MVSLGASLRSCSESPYFRDPTGAACSGSAPSCSSSEHPQSDTYCPFLSALEARKRTEQDSILLANRIRFLKAEDERTRKNIRETEKKTHDLLSAQQRKEEHRAVREAEVARREAEKQELRAQITDKREEQQKRLEQKQSRLLEKNAASSSSVRQEREEGLRRVQRDREVALATQAAKVEQVRRAEINASKVRARSEGAKHDFARSVVRERIIRAEDAKNEHLQDIERMELEEQALLEKLQQSQQRHRAAFLQLEDVMKQAGGHVVAPDDTPSNLELHGSVAALAAASAAAAAVCGSRRPPRPRGSLGGYSTAVANNAQSRPSAFAGSDGSSRIGSTRTSPRNSPTRRRTSGGVCLAIPKSVLKTGSQPRPLADALRFGGPVGQEANQSSSQVACRRGGTATDSRNGALASSAEMTRCSAPVKPSPSLKSEPLAVSMTYTTVDGTQLDIPAEDDLDLATLLNG